VKPAGDGCREPEVAAEKDRVGALVKDLYFIASFAVEALNKVV
jgi:hypothetical protein